MKKGLVIVFALLVTACSSVSGLGMFQKSAPKVLSGDDSQVLLYDAKGVAPDLGQTTANKYCAVYGKTAEFKSKGGYDNDCVSAQFNYCMTYTCK
jgi:hypothetical protein